MFIHHLPSVSTFLSTCFFSMTITEIRFHFVTDGRKNATLDSMYNDRIFPSIGIETDKSDHLACIRNVLDDG